MAARIRSIKPEVHLDEDLWDLEEETGLPIFRSFVGLWNHSDREGRFEWRPRKLKAGILPYWNDDFSRVLDALTTRGFVVRYTSEGREYGWVRTFTRHQVINNREAASILPAPPADVPKTSGATRDDSGDPRVDHASPTREVHALAEGKGREGKGRDKARVPDATGDSLESFAQAWRDGTGRSEFKDFVEGCGQLTGTERDWLIRVRKICEGSAAEFCARVAARIAEDTKGFLRKQTLLYWESGPLQAPAAPQAPATPAAPYHRPIAERTDDDDGCCTYAESLGQGASQ